MNKLPSGLHNLFSALLVLGMAVGVHGCSSSSSGEADVLNSYNGPGSKWDVVFRDDDTFTVTRRANATAAVDLTVNGDYSRLASGFTRFVVSDASGTDAPSAGDEAWGLEIQGYSLMLKPVDPTSDQIIPMINAGTCPSSDFDANWVLVKKANAADATDNGRDFFGTFSYTEATNTPALPARWALDNLFTAQGAGTIAAGPSCADGLMLLTDAEMYLTENGGAIVHTNLSTPTDSSFIFALSQNAITDINNLDGAYAGILFDEDAAPGTQIKPVAVTCGAGSCTGNVVTDVVNNTLSADTVTIGLTGAVDTPATGFVTGTITGNVGTGNLACMADYNALGGGKKIISCVGQSPDSNTQMFNVILVSK